LFQLLIKNMARIMAIDYGTKRTGLSVTDPLQIIATALDTVPTFELMPYLKKYLEKEVVELFVVGEPKRLNNTPAQSAPKVAQFVKILQQQFSTIPIIMVDERFTSKMAFQSMIDMGMKKSERKNKENIDKISAVIILQSYLQSIGK
jgi:putative holliday junction resolvase